MSIIVVDLMPAHLSQVLTINQASRPAVGDLDQDRLAELVGWSAHARGVIKDGELVGYLLALEPGAPYRSVNYQYFETHLDDHVYVDRIAVAPGHRDGGIGEALYRDLFARVPGRAVSCEVNVVPMNAGSLRFHTRLGFASVGQQATEGGKKRVSLLVRPG